MLALLLGVATSLVAAPAKAQDSAARSHFHAGSGYFETGNYEDALKSFTLAYEMSQRPQLLYNLYLTEERLGDLRSAIRYLERYLSEVEEVPNRDVLSVRLANLRRRAEADEREAAEKEAADTKDAAFSSEPEGSETIQQDVPPESAPSASEAAIVASEDEAPSHASPSLAPAITSIAITGVAGIGWGVFGTLALMEDARLAATCGAGDCVESDVAVLRRWSLLSDISMGVTLAGAVASAVFLVVHGSARAREAAPITTYLTPWVAPRGAGLSAMGSF